MTTATTQSDRTSAAKQLAGFEYQYWFFLLSVLQLKQNESVGLETSDDVHSRLNNDRQILFQLKHSLKTQADGSPASLTGYDRDLWKTISNWSKIISDPAADRKDEPQQLSFIAKSTFVLVTNKSEADRSPFPAIQNSPETARKSLLTLKDGTSSTDIQRWIGNILSLTDAVLMQFICNIKILHNTDEIIERCKTVLVEKQIAPARVDQLLRDLDSQIRQDNFFAIKSGQKVELTFTEFNRRYRRFFDQARSTQLLIRKSYTPLPEAIQDQTFIRQLLDINDIQDDDLDSMVTLTRQKQHAEHNLTTWEIEGELTGIEKRDFDNDCIIRWQNSFRKHHRNTQNPTTSAQNCLDELREIELHIDDQRMGFEFSNGQFYRLTDIPHIGFVPTWTQRYKTGKS